MIVDRRHWPDGNQQAQPALRAIEAISPPPEDTFSLREEIELLTADLRGYAGQLQVHQEIANPSAAIRAERNPTEDKS